MKKMIAAFALLGALLVPVRAIAQMAQDHPYDSPKATITVAQAIVVGSTVLKAGEYKFQCRTFGGKTFLVVTTVDTNKEIVRVPCVRENLNATVTESQFRTITRDDKRILVSVQIRGEAAAHNVIVD